MTDPYTLKSVRRRVILKHVGHNLAASIPGVLKILRKFSSRDSYFMMSTAPWPLRVLIVKSAAMALYHAYGSRFQHKFLALQSKYSGNSFFTAQSLPPRSISHSPFRWKVHATFVASVLRKLCVYPSVLAPLLCTDWRRAGASETWRGRWREISGGAHSRGSLYAVTRNGPRRSLLPCCEYRGRI